MLSRCFTPYTLRPETHLDITTANGVRARYEKRECMWCGWGGEGHEHGTCRCLCEFARTGSTHLQRTVNTELKRIAPGDNGTCLWTFAERISLRFPCTCWELPNWITNESIDGENEIPGRNVAYVGLYGYRRRLKCEKKNHDNHIHCSRR